MARSKILFCITKSNWGGAQAYVYALATRLAADGHEVAVALGGTGLPGADTGQLAERLQAAGVRTIHLSSMARDLSILREVRSFVELLRVIRGERPQVLHLNSSKAGILGAVAGRIAGVPRIVFTAHGWPHREPRPLPMRIIIWIASWATILFSHIVIAVSERDLRTAPVFVSRSKVRVVRNGISPFPLASREEARRTLAPHLPHGSFWFLMNAELHTNKGIDRGIRALVRVRQSFPDTHLVIVGSGQEEAALQKLARTFSVEEAVHFSGFVPDARQYLLAGDCYLIPSRKEGLPMALLEAGAAALPVIASVTGGIPEVVSDGSTGWLIPVDGDAALADAMLEARADQIGAAVRGTALQTRVLSDFSEDQMYERTKALYGI